MKAVALLSLTVLLILWAVPFVLWAHFAWRWRKEQRRIERRARARKGTLA